MPVDSQHKEYSDSLSKWQLVRDCDEGSKAVKSRSAGGSGSNTLNGMAGTAYLPAPNAEDISTANRERFLAYLKRANFVNFTGHTKEGMLGLVFRKKTLIETQPALDYLIEDANGAGLSSDQMIKDVAGDVLMLGRYGLLVEYPTAQEGMTEAQVRDLNLRANIISYPAESVINWRTETYGGISKLSLVVLVEPTEKCDDGFEKEVVDYHRVLLLKEVSGKITYVQNLYNDEGNLVLYKGEDNDLDDEGIVNLYSDIIPRKNDGSTWDEIPFTFVGSVNNDADVDKAPLYDIAEVNIAHYRNSADYEESSFIVGQPTPVITGLTQGWVDENMKDGIAFGSRTAVLLPTEGNAFLLQANDNQMPEKGMERKEVQMRMIGARIIEDTSGAETVDAVKIRFAGQNSKLGSIIGNVEAAFKQCYTWASEFMGGGDETTLTINREFYDASIDPQMLVAGIQAMDRGVIAKTDLRNLMRKSSLIDAERTDDDIDGEAEDIGSEV